MTPRVESDSALRLLLVEDDLRSADLLRDLLKTSQVPRFDIQHVTTAGEARRVVETGQPDLVILDLGLPDATDLEALTRLEDSVHEIPVIVLTGRGDESLASDALHRGAEDYLLKGNINLESLLRSIRYAIERHGSIRDLARLKKQLELANRDLERLTLIDPLTEVLNRRGLQQAISREVQQLQRGLKGAAILLVDIDDFKTVNANLGHAVGDVVLKEIGRRLRTSVQAIDYVGRVGGDVFMLVLPETDHDQLTRIAELVRLAISTSIIQHTTSTVTLTASIAALMLSTDTPAIDQLLARGHLLISRAKSEGKNRVIFEPVEFDDTDKRRQSQSDMCSNLSKGKYIKTVKQPIYRLSDESPIGYEFLTRYENETFEMPENFFRMCSERNVLTLVDHFCLRKAVEAAMNLPPYVRFHLNVFPTTLLAIPVEHLLEIFPKPLPPKTFWLEISEQQIIGDPSYLSGIVRALQSAGIMIAIDDVGFGSSCLESLVLLRPDMMKIDKRCVTGISQDETRVEHLRRYVGIARALGCEIVAEGIETAADLAAMRGVGIEYGQGFFWGKPA